jgi:hypothetical protein
MVAAWWAAALATAAAQQLHPGYCPSPDLLPKRVPKVGITEAEPAGGGTSCAGVGLGGALTLFFAVVFFFVFLTAFFTSFFFFLRAGAARLALDFFNFDFFFFRFFDFAMIVLPIGSTKTCSCIGSGIAPQPVPYSAAAGIRPAFVRSASGTGPPVAQSSNSTV